MGEQPAEKLLLPGGVLGRGGVQLVAQLLRPVPPPLQLRVAPDELQPGQGLVPFRHGVRLRRLDQAALRIGEDPVPQVQAAVVGQTVGHDEAVLPPISVRGHHGDLGLLPGGAALTAEVLLDDVHNGQNFHGGALSR